MKRNNVIFNADNIISTLNINVGKRFTINFKETYNSFGATSRLTIDDASKSRYCFMTENFENDDIPHLIAGFDVVSINEGDFKTLINIQHPQFKAMMTIVNRYITVFMIVAGKKEAVHNQTINLHMAVKYSVSGPLTISNISLISLVMIREYDSVTKFNIEENIENIVDKYLKKVGLNNIDKDTDMEHMLSLVKMQKTVDDMELI